MSTQFAASVAGVSAVKGDGSNGATGITGTSDTNKGVSGSSQSGYGVYGTSSISSAAYFEVTNASNTLPALVATTSGNNTGLNVTSQGGVGIACTSQGNTGISGTSQVGTGVAGSGNIGIEGFCTSTNGTGVLGHPPSGGGGFAGKFLGNVDVQGTLNKSALTFKIDHPLDPARKYLLHAGVESIEMKNLYDGTVALDDAGEATVELPGWFEALNTEFRYQLTCVGGYASVYIAQEVQNNRFKIAGGKAGMKVSWQITGKRHDPYAQAYPLVVEEEKPEEEHGYYRHPELYHEPEEKGIAWAQFPEQMQRLKQMRMSGTNSE